MDEEELEQPKKKKITLSNFFESIVQIDKLANRALSTANSNLNLIQDQKLLIESLSMSLEGLKSDVQQINNYIIVEKKIEKDAEADLRLEEEDKEQKQMMSERLKGDKGEDGDKGEGGDQGDQGDTGKPAPQPVESKGFLGSALGALAPILGGVGLQFLAPILGGAFTGLKSGGPIGALIGGPLGGALEYSGMRESLTGETPSPKTNLFETTNPFARLGGMFGRKFGKKDEGVEGGKNQIKEEIKSEIKEELNLTGGGEEPFSTSIKYSTKGNMETGEIEVDPNSLEPGVPIEAAQQHFYMSKIKELQFKIRNSKREFGDDYDTSSMEKELKKFSDKYNSTLESGGIDYANIGKPEKKENKLIEFMKEGGVAGFLNRRIGDSIRNFDGRPGSRKTKENLEDTGDKKSKREMVTYTDGSRTISIFKGGSLDSLSKEDVIQKFTELNDRRIKAELAAKKGDKSAKFLSRREQSDLKKLGIMLEGKFKVNTRSIESNVDLEIKGKKDDMNLIEVDPNFDFDDNPYENKKSNIEAGFFTPITEEDLERERALDAEEGNIFSRIGNTLGDMKRLYNEDKKTPELKLSGEAERLIGDDKPFLDEVQRVSEKYEINPADLVGLMASESSLDPKADNGTHVGLIQFSADRAKELGTTQEELVKMSRVQQMKFVEKYFDIVKLPKGASKGELYTSVFMPEYTDRGTDFELSTKFDKFSDGEPGNPSVYAANQGLDADDDGFITVGEMGSRITKKQEEFGISSEKESKPEGIMRILTGIADRVTGEKFDFDQRGDLIPKLENDTAELSGNVLAPPDDSYPKLSAGVIKTLNETALSGNSSPLVQAEAPQVSEAEIKSTETTSSFIKTISNNTIASSKKSKFGLPPEIARMIT